VSRPGAPFGQHQSEKEMFKMLQKGIYDYQIENNGTLEDLFNKIKKLI